MNKEQAKQNLLILINMCVKAGGIFNNAEAVLTMVDSVNTLCAELPVMGKSPEHKSASEQIGDRLNGKN